MAKILVNIIDPADPLPAYLFVKEHWEAGDKLMFIAGHRDARRIQQVARALKANGQDIISVVMASPEEDLKYEYICRRILNYLSKDASYEVNLAGGSRYMALAVQHVFEGFNAKFFYVKTRENQIISTIFDDSLYDEDDYCYPIRHRMSLSEYFQVYGLRHDLRQGGHTPIRDVQTVLRFFRAYAYGHLNDQDYHTIDLLREYYRDYRGILSIPQLIAKGSGTRYGKPQPSLPGLPQLFQHAGFIPATKDQLTHPEVDYLTGGWFEDYVYYIVRSAIHPDDIATGIVISEPGQQHSNELDVVFIKNNQLFVIECKTGVQSVSLFNTIVYKACALREALLGMTAHSYIFTLKPDRDGHLHQVARLMNITFADRGALTSNGIQKIFEKIKTLCV